MFNRIKRGLVFVWIVLFGLALWEVGTSLDPTATSYTARGFYVTIRDAEEDPLQVGNYY